MILILFMFDIIAILSPLVMSVAKADNISSEIIIDVRTNRVLYGENIDTKKYMASTTKILTAITVIENSNLDSLVTVSKDTTNIEGSSIYLEEGEVLSVLDLLYGLMLRSGNDCAMTLAKYVGGNIETFVDLMNNTAKKIGANSSSFINPHGLHDDNHYTTAYDLALITSYALKNDTFRKIVSTKSIYIPFTTQNTRRLLKNKNKLLFNLDGTTGVKTGYTKKAGRCLVSSCKKGDLELICVVLNCPDMFNRSSNLLNEYLEKYKAIKLVDSKNIIDFVNSNNENCPLYIKNDVVLPLSTEELNNISIVYDYSNRIENLDKDVEVGKIEIYIKNDLIFTEKIYTMISTKN